MKVLIACEESGTVRRAFRKSGVKAWSCDLLESRSRGHHLVGDAKDWIKGYPMLEASDPFNAYVKLAPNPDNPWDLLIAFPPCTHLCVSGARWFKDKQEAQKAAVEFFMKLWESPIQRIAIENPIGIMSTKFRKPDQIIQPWMFGHPETKATCLWLKGLPPLVPTNIVEGREARIHKMAPGPNRARDRSVTYQGIADAMANQWGSL